MRFEVFRGRRFAGFGRRQWFWRLVARNGEILASSEGHQNKADVLDIVRKIRDEVVRASVEVVA